MHEYPKMLYRGDDVTACLTDSITVEDAAGEDAARADGFELYAEIAAGLAAAPEQAPVEPVEPIELELDAYTDIDSDADDKPARKPRRAKAE